MRALKSGDRIAYTARHLRDTGQHTGAAPQRRGTVASCNATWCRVHWDDEAELIADGSGQYADLEYVEDVRRHGSMVRTACVARVSSRAFSMTD